MREAPDAGRVDDLSLVIAAVVLGGRKRLFHGFERSLDLERLGVRRIRRLAETNR